VRHGLYFAAALIAGALLANFLLADPGYFALRFAGRLVEMSAVTFVLVAVGVYFLIRLVVKAMSARRLWQAAQVERRHARARRSLARGLLEMAEGEWSRAENTLTQGAREADIPAAHYLVAARAADLQGAAERRDEWIARALEASTDRRTPALIMQAEMHLKHKQVHAALATLEQLEASGEINARGLLLLARVLRQTGDWQRLQALEPRLRQTKEIPVALADETVAQVHLDRLRAAGAAKDSKLLAEAWQGASKTLRQRPEIVVAYARAAMACDQQPAAESELRDLLSHTWDEAAVLAYGELDPDEPLQILDYAERWLPEHPEDAALLLTCARLSIRAELYGKARSYLETSIAIKPRLEAYQLLATLLEQLGDRERAYRVLSDALIKAIGRKPDIPKIRAHRWHERRQRES
jgi:HemY protein